MNPFAVNARWRRSLAAVRSAVASCRKTIARIGDAPDQNTIGHVFETIYRTHAWPGSESVSGPGSGLVRTALIRDDLTRLVRALDVKVILDAGCGDFNWMNETDLAECRYIGVDVVPELIGRNRTLYAAAGREFEVCDVTRDPLPAVDLIVCRDCLVHLPFREALRALENFKASGSTYLLTTTFTARTANADIVIGQWRPLNLQRAPFDLPEPLGLIDERCQVDDGRYSDKRLALWPLARL
jgi:SAM-dependent methyltransferase